MSTTKSLVRMIADFFDYLDPLNDRVDAIDVLVAATEDAVSALEVRVTAAEGAAAGGLVQFSTVAQAAANLAYPAFTGALILADPAGDVTNGNGYYQKQGASGVGSWLWVRLPWRADAGTLREVTAAGDVTVSTTEAGVALNRTIEDDTIVNIPSAADRAAAGGGDITIKDLKGNAGTYEYVLNPASGTVDNFAAYVLRRDFACVVLSRLADNSGYFIKSIGP